MSAPELRVFESAQELAAGAALEVVACLRAALDERGRATLVLAGGSTPRALYQRVAAEPLRSELAWERVELFFGDERCVPPDDAHSNYRMARESLLEPLGIAPERVHRMRGELGPVEGARAYAEELRQAFAPDPPRFDLVLLGMGADGHTASLFPGDAAVRSDLLAAPARAPAPPTHRITLTLPVLNAARIVLFLVSGSDKSTALARVLDLAAKEPPPASLVRPSHGRLLWHVDRAAAALLASS